MGGGIDESFASSVATAAAVPGAGGGRSELTRLEPGGGAIDPGFGGSDERRGGGVDGALAAAGVTLWSTDVADSSSAIGSIVVAAISFRGLGSLPLPAAAAMNIAALGRRTDSSLLAFASFGFASGFTSGVASCFASGLASSASCRSDLSGLLCWRFGGGGAASGGAAGAGGTERVL